MTILLFIAIILLVYLCYLYGLERGKLIGYSEADEEINNLMAITERAIKLNDELINDNKELLKLSRETLGDNYEELRKN